MPGSGKTAVGGILASRLGWEFVDTDKCIEGCEGMPLQAVLDRLGEEAFRRLEEETVLALDPKGPAVISTGGSVVYSEAAMRHLEGISSVFFLAVTLDAIRSHIGAESPRGIIGLSEGGLEGLLEERLPLYLRYAGAVVLIGPEGPEAAAGKILSRLPPDWQKQTP